MVLSPLEPPQYALSPPRAGTTIACRSQNSLLAARPKSIIPPRHKRAPPPPRTPRGLRVILRLALHDDLHRRRVDPELLPLQGGVHVRTVLSPIEQLGHRRGGGDGRRGREGAGAVEEAEVAAVVSVEDLNDHAEEGDHEHRGGEEMHGGFAIVGDNDVHSDETPCLRLGEEIVRTSSTVVFR